MSCKVGIVARELPGLRAISSRILFGQSSLNGRTKIVVTFDAVAYHRRL